MAEESAPAKILRARNGGACGVCIVGAATEALLLLSLEYKDWVRAGELAEVVVEEVVVATSSARLSRSSLGTR